MRIRSHLIFREMDLRQLTGDDFVAEALGLIDAYRRHNVRMAQKTVRMLERRGINVPPDVRPLSRYEREMLDQQGGYHERVDSSATVSN